jgi:hypothetical protein
VSERTFFRYFATKASVLWIEFDAEVDAIRAASGPGDVAGAARQPPSRRSWRQSCSPWRD